jgi:primase-polymerase (primpol)-like protein
MMQAGMPKTANGERSASNLKKLMKDKYHSQHVSTEKMHSFISLAKNMDNCNQSINHIVSSDVGNYSGAVYKSHFRSKFRNLKKFPNQSSSITSIQTASLPSTQLPVPRLKRTLGNLQGSGDLSA